MPFSHTQYDLFHIFFPSPSVRANSCCKTFNFWVVLSCWFLPPLQYSITGFCLLSHPPSLPPNICHCIATVLVQLFCTERKTNYCGVTASAWRILLVCQLEKSNQPTTWHSHKRCINISGANVGAGALVLVGKLRRNCWPRCHEVWCLVTFKL